MGHAHLSVGESILFIHALTTTAWQLSYLGPMKMSAFKVIAFGGSNSRDFEIIEFYFQEQLPREIENARDNSRGR